MCGIKTNIVTAVEIRHKDPSDTELLPDLVNATAVNFHIREVLGDRAYGSLKSYNVISGHNICCSIQESYELGISPTFCGNSAPAQKPAVS